MTSLHRPWQRLIAVLLAVLQFQIPAVAQTVAESAAAVEAFSISDVVPSLPSTALLVGSENATKSRSAPVSSRGTFSKNIPIQVPSGRLGMTPSLALTYDSGAFRQDSPVGAGWTLSTSRIARSTLYGFPQLKRTDNTLIYDDTKAKFEADGKELGELPADLIAPSRLFSDGKFYVMLRETVPIVYEYSASQNAWVEHRPDGVKRHYGLDTNRRARIKNELGTFAWLLLREIDRFGNDISYEYHFIDQQDRTDKYAAQLEPILREVTWGGNANNEPHPFQLVVKLANQNTHGAPDLLRGNTQVSGAVSSIVVCGPDQIFTKASGKHRLRSPSEDCKSSLYWSYVLNLENSVDTGRKLLKRVTRKNPWGDSERTWALDYQGNGGKVAFGPPEPLVRVGDPKNQLLFTRYGNRLDISNDSQDKAINPSETSIGTRFVDLNHDGRVDVVYHPSGISSPEAAILREGTIDSPMINSDEFARSQLRTPQGGWEDFTVSSVGFKELHFRYSDLADVNGDGRVDAVFFNASIGEFPGNRRKRKCFSEEFWHRCGVIDPLHWNICEQSNLCEPEDELDMTMCANGQCWITPTDLNKLFGDWADWSKTPPFSAEGQKILAENKATIDQSQALISVPATLLRTRLKIPIVPKESMITPLFMANTQAKCEGLMNQCRGGSTDGVPGPRIGIDLDSTLVKLGKWGKDSNNVRTLPPMYRMNYHAGGGSASAIAPTIPLHGWPAGVYKQISLTENPEPGPKEWSARPGADFSAPFVDVNADGLADLILLKSTEITLASTMLPSVEFTPRAFLTRRNQTTGDGLPDIKMELDWKSFLDQYPDSSGDNSIISDFTQSLQDILVKPGASYCNTVDCVPENELTYPIGPNYNALFLDLNSDGLPDLVSATPDTDKECPRLGPRNHQIFLNRGYRFGTPVKTATPNHHPWSEVSKVRHERPIPVDQYASGPFKRLLKRDLAKDVSSRCQLTLEDSLPMAAASFTDINADGRVDVIFQWHDFLSSEISRQIFLNQGTQWRELSETLANSYGLPMIPLANVDGNSLRGFSMGDLARLEDVDNDGLVDFVAAGTFCFAGDQACKPIVHPDMPGPLQQSRWKRIGDYKVIPAFFYKNKGKVPDLLTRIEQESGAYTNISYAPARTGPVNSRWVPPGLMVVSEIRRGANAESSPEHIRLSYDNYVKSANTPEPLGFEKVIAEFENRDGATVTGRLKQTRIFDIHSRVEGIDFPYPGKGLELETISEADDRKESTVSTYAYVVYGSGVRIRPTRTDTKTCTLFANGSCDSNYQAMTRTETLAWDEFGQPTEVLSGDLVNGQISETDRIRVLTSYDSRPDLWLLGNRKSETVRGRHVDLTGKVTDDAVLSDWSARYDVQARLENLEYPEVTPMSCRHAVTATVAKTEILAYDQRGMPRKVRTNGRSTVTLDYDKLNIYVQEQSVEVEKFLDGVKQFGTTKLVNRIERDLRTGEVWSSRDTNGSITQIQRDSFGRPTRQFDATGAEISRFAYQDTFPVRQKQWRFTSISGEAQYVETKLNGAGQVLAQFESKWMGGQASDTVRTQASDYDSAGNPVRIYLPKATNAMPATGDLRISKIFDGFGMLIRQQSPDGTLQGRVTQISYEPRRTISTDPRGTVTKQVNNWRGAVASIERAGGSDIARIIYERDGLGRLVELVDADEAVRSFEYDNAGRIYRYTLPHAASAAASGIFEQCFDVDGVLVQSTDPTGGQIRMIYDNLSRPVLKEVDVESASTSHRYTYSYDNQESDRKATGRLWRSTSPLGATELRYDTRGFMTEGHFEPAAAMLGGIGWPKRLITDIQYGLQGELKNVSYRIGKEAGALAGKFTYVRDARGRLVGINEGTDSLASNLHYDAFQRMDMATLGTDITAQWQWAAESQDLIRLEYKQADSTLIRIGREQFDKGGNPGKESRVGEGTTVEKTHSFDGLERLKSSRVTVGGTVVKDEAFAYSPGGRLLQAGSRSYTYGKASLAGAVTSVGDRVLEYDAGGNTIRDYGGERHLKYDAQGCMISIKDTNGGFLSAGCDDGGNHLYRSTQTTEGIASRVLKLGLSELRPDDGILLHRLPLNGSILLEVAYQLSDGMRDAEQSRIIMLDARGSIVATAPLDGGAAQTRQAVDYDVWGAKMSLGSTEEPRHAFVGFEPDEIYGTYAFGRRIYDPELRRWLSADPLLSAMPEGDIRQLDLYAYAADNPIELIDLNGGYADNLAVSMIPYVGPTNDAGLATERALIAYENGDNITALSQGILASSYTVLAVADVISLGAVSGVRWAVAAASLEASSLFLRIESKNATAAALSAEVPKSMSPEISVPYKRPSGATIPQQRESVQGKPCVDCGAFSSKMYADHKKPLVEEYYETGKIDKSKMKSIEAVQPQCPTCSNQQGGKMSQYSKVKKKELSLDKK